MTFEGLQNEDWRKTLLPIGASLSEAIQCLEKSSMQIGLVVRDDDFLVGTITDGDIRRAFLRGLQMEDSVDEAVQKNPFVVSPEFGRETVLRLMQINKIHQLPVVDKNGVVMGLHIWDAVASPSSHENSIIIMAGGKGTRLRPFTENCPKPMLEINGKPMIEHIIDGAKNVGFRKFTISIHYLGEMIEDYFGDGEEFGVSIEYLKEKAPLGTAGCLSLLQNEQTRPFIVTNGDVLTDINYEELLEFHVRHGADATMAVRQHEIQNQFGVVHVDGVKIVGFEEKPLYRSYINAGIYVLEPSVLHRLETNTHCDMPTLFERVKELGGRTIVYPMHEPWLDVGRPSDLDEAKRTVGLAEL